MGNLRKGSRIAFSCPDELRFGIKVMGTVIGHAKEIRERWPEEMGELKDDVEAYLVRRNIPAMGIVRHYAVFPEEILEKNQILKKEAK